MNWIGRQSVTELEVSLNCVCWSKEQLNMVFPGTNKLNCTDLGYFNFQTSKLHSWFNCYSNFAKLVDFALLEYVALGKFCKSGLFTVEIDITICIIITITVSVLNSVVFCSVEAGHGGAMFNSTGLGRAVLGTVLEDVTVD